MLSFRKLFNSELKNATPDWMEMAVNMTPKDTTGWMAQLSPAAKNLLSLTPNTSKSDYDEEEEDKGQKS